MIYCSCVRDNSDKWRYFCFIGGLKPWLSSPPANMHDTCNQCRGPQLSSPNCQSTVQKPFRALSLDREILGWWSFSRKPQKARPQNRVKLNEKEAQRKVYWLKSVLEGISWCQLFFFRSLKWRIGSLLLISYIKFQLHWKCVIYLWTRIATLNNWCFKR